MYTYSPVTPLLRLDWCKPVGVFWKRLILIAGSPASSGFERFYAQQEFAPLVKCLPDKLLSLFFLLYPWHFDGWKAIFTSDLHHWTLKIKYS